MFVGTEGHKPFLQHPTFVMYIHHHVTVRLKWVCEDRTWHGDPLGAGRSFWGLEYWWVDTTAPSLPLFTLVSCILF